MGMMPATLPVRRIYDPSQDHTRGLTVEICRAKIEELDEKLAACDGTTWGDDAKIQRWQESLAFFLRHLDRLARKRGWQNPSYAAAPDP